MNKRTIIILLLILSLQLILRLPFLGVPLERDEGFYGYAAQRVLAGETPYRDFFDHKPPAIYYIYALIIKFFGPSLTAIRGATAFYGLLTTLAVFGVGLLLFGAGGGLLAALIYAVYSGGPFIQGPFSNTEVFMVLPVTLALFFFLLARREKKISFYFLVGLLSGLAVTIKQVAVFNFLVLFFALIAKERLKAARPSAGLLAGFLSFPLFFVLYFWSQGALADLINCTLVVNKHYLSQSPAPFFFFDPRYGLSAIWEIILWENGPLWLLAIAGFALILAKEKKPLFLLLVVWSFFSFCGVAAGNLFFGHYFIQVIPALSLLAAYFLVYQIKNFTFAVKGGILILLGCCLLFNLQFQLPFYTKYNPYRITEVVYGTRTFGIAYWASAKIAKEIKPEDDIFVWAAEPEVYYYLGKRALTKYSFYFIWMFGLIPRQDIIGSLASGKPTFILLTDYQPAFPSLEKLIAGHYNLKTKYYSWLLYERKR
ncbi:MAG: glycosyltransferase family 39 protein [Candidatus Margulisbacteria bacterium]|nr:glycosyltransferase family 39 protein [Candidatus Margulisiibacteriota bacterium]